MSTVTAPHPHASQEAERRTDAHRVPSRLGRYTDDRSGAKREIVCVPGAGGSRLVKAALLHLMKLGGCGDLAAVFARRRCFLWGGVCR